MESVGNQLLCAFPGCTVKFANAIYLKRHLVKHSDRYKCDPCDHSFASNHHLREHFQTESHRKKAENLQGDDRKTLVCPFCMKTFFDKVYLRHHIEKRICRTAKETEPSKPMQEEMPKLDSVLNHIDKNTENYSEQSMPVLVQDDNQYQKPNKPLSLFDRIEQFKEETSLSSYPTKNK